MALLENLRPIESTRFPALPLSGGRFDSVKRCRLWQVELDKAKSFTQILDTDLQRILPPETGKSGKICVGRVQLTAMLDCQGSQMGVGNQVSSRFSLEQHLLKNLPMIPGGIDHAGAGLVQPALHALDGVIRSKGISEDPAVGSNPDERGDNRPTQTYRFSTGEASIPPFTRRGMTGTQAVLGIEQYISVYQDQRNSSPSAWARSSWILSRS